MGVNEGLSVGEAMAQIDWDPLDLNFRQQLIEKITKGTDVSRLDLVNDLKMQQNDLFYSKHPTYLNHFYNATDGGKFYPDYLGLAQYFKDELHFICDDSYQYIYNGTHFVDISNKMLRQKVMELTSDHLRPAHLEQFIKFITAHCALPIEDFKTREGLLNLKNGVLDIKSGVMYTHSPTYRFRYVLDHEYNKSAQCPQFLRFLNYIFQDSPGLINLVGEILGYTIIGGEPTKHRAFMFYGSGRNGKSTLLDTTRELLGKKNVSSVSMKLIDKPFSAVRLSGMLANIVEESPHQIDAEAFKNIVGGGTISAAFKGRDEFDLKVNCRMFFACNEFPHFKDATKGNRDRLVIVPFNKYIPDSERDTDILVKLRSELSGILNFALDGYRRLKKNGDKFTVVREVEEAHKEFIVSTDNVAAWADENIEKEEHSFAVVDLMYQDYKKFCEDNGNHCTNKDTFSKRLCVMLDQKTSRKWTGQRRIRVHEGVKCTGPIYKFNQNWTG